MNRKITLSTSLNQIVSRNTFFASALYKMGVDYSEYPNASLAEACNGSGISVFVALNKLNSIENDYKSFDKLENLTVESTIAYLKYVHSLIIRERLPYIQSLTEMIRPNEFTNKELANDLKLLMPVYSEDFIKHIRSEEDSLFRYISDLIAVQNDKNSLSTTVFKYRNFSLKSFAHDHAHEEETDGIKLITDDYAIDPSASEIEKIVIQELKDYDKEMEEHARIENELLLPKAIYLEQEIFDSLKSYSLFN